MQAATWKLGRGARRRYGHDDAAPRRAKRTIPDAAKDAWRPTPTKPEAVKKWLERWASRDPREAEGVAGGCAAESAIDATIKAEAADERARPGRSIATLVEGVVRKAGHWCASPKDERLRFALGLFEVAPLGEGGAVFEVIQRHVLAGRADRAAVALRGAARGLRVGCLWSVGPAGRPHLDDAKPIPREAWDGLCDTAAELQVLGGVVLEAAAASLDLHPHFLEYFRGVDIPRTSRGDAAAATFRGDL